MDIEEDRNFYPDKETVKTHELCATVGPINMKRKGFRNITGALTHKSSRVNMYVMVIYDYNSNAILAKQIK